MCVFRRIGVERETPVTAFGFMIMNMLEVGGRQAEGGSALWPTLKPTPPPAFHPPLSTSQPPQPLLRPPSPTPASSPPKTSWFPAPSLSHCVCVNFRDEWLSVFHSNMNAVWCCSQTGRLIHTLAFPRFQLASVSPCKTIQACALKRTTPHTQLTASFSSARSGMKFCHGLICCHSSGLIAHLCVVCALLLFLSSARPVLCGSFPYNY